MLRGGAKSAGKCISTVFIFTKTGFQETSHGCRTQGKTVYVSYTHLDQKYFLVLEIVEVFVLSGFFDVFRKIFKFFVVPHCKTGSQRFVI